MIRLIAGALLLAGAATLSGCMPGNSMAPIVDTKPAITIPLGAHQADVVALLGPPTRGPKVEAYSELVELDYVFPFPAVSAETVLGGKRLRTEAADRVYMFFDRSGVLRKMGTHADPYYRSFVTAPADRITIAARALDAEGRQIPMTQGIWVPPPPKEETVPLGSVGGGQ